MNLNVSGISLSPKIPDIYELSMSVSQSVTKKFTEQYQLH